MASDYYEPHISIGSPRKPTFQIYINLQQKIYELNKFHTLDPRSSEILALHAPELEDIHSPGICIEPIILGRTITSRVSVKLSFHSWIYKHQENPDNSDLRFQ